VLLKRQQEAQELADLLTDPAKKVRALLQIAGQIREQLNQEREWLALLLRACEKARTIKDTRRRAEALMGLAAVLAPLGEQEQLLGLIQHSWRLVKTREQALTLFSLVTELIPRNPELGSALYKAFTWVDTFLKG
jgi:hypothetical protein